MAHPLAGQKVPKDMLIDTAKLVSEYFYIDSKLAPIKFGTSGHRGSATKHSFNEKHIFAISQAICDYKKEHNIKGPLYIGIDTHALSTPAKMSALRVFAANQLDIYHTTERTPTPLISFAILEHNKKQTQKADGIVLTPSHNPPQDGGYKYNPPNGGAAETSVTQTVEKKANAILQKNGYKTLSYEDALASSYVHEHDFITPYVEALDTIIDIEAIKKSRLKLAADPLGGSAIALYKKINEIYNLDITILHDYIDYTFSFMTLDHDGKIRMDCSSAYAMATLVQNAHSYDLAWANDTDSDRHGIVTPYQGLMNPNHYLAVAIWYLYQHRHWPKLKIGKTFVTSSMIDRIAQSLGIEVYETPVGFKWFAKGLYDGWLGFAGEESSGATFLRKDATVWTTDKDGIVMGLLAAEIRAKVGDPAKIYERLEERFGKSYYQRLDIAANEQIRQKLRTLTPEQLHITTLAGEKIERIYTRIGDICVGGIKIVAPNGWVAMRPSGTEDIYKIYAESFLSAQHLKQLQQEAQQIVRMLQ